MIYTNHEFVHFCRGFDICCMLIVTQMLLSEYFMGCVVIGMLYYPCILYDKTFLGTRYFPAKLLMKDYI